MAALAVLYDVHGNQPALAAVLADARSAGSEGFVLGGDYALFGRALVPAHSGVRGR